MARRNLLAEARALASRLTPDAIEDPIKKKLQEMELGRINLRRTTGAKVNKALRTPITGPAASVSRELGRFLTTDAPLASTMRGIGRGTTNVGTFNFTNIPHYSQPTGFERVGELAGGLVAGAASYGKLAGPAEAVGKGALRFAPQAGRLTRTVLPALTRESIQTGAGALGSRLGGNEFDVKSDLAFGLGLSAIGGAGALRGMGKSLDQGRRVRPLHPEDAKVLDNAMEIVNDILSRKNKKGATYQVEPFRKAYKDIFTLADGYLTKAEIDDIVSKGGNNFVIAEEIGKAIQKKGTNVDYGGVKMSLAGDAQPTKGIPTGREADRVLQEMSDRQYKILSEDWGDNQTKNLLQKIYGSADSAGKRKLLETTVRKPELKNEMLRAMYENIKIESVNNPELAKYANMSFDEFINSPITLYRGGGVSDPFLDSFTPIKSVAERFAGQGRPLNTITVKPKDTLGSLTAGGWSGEAEVFVPSKNLGEDMYWDMFNQYLNQNPKAQGKYDNLYNKKGIKAVVEEIYGKPKNVAQPTKGDIRLYRGGTEFDPSRGGNRGISLTTDPKRAEFFTKSTQGPIGETGRVVQELKLDPKAKIATVDDLPKSVMDKFRSGDFDDTDVAQWVKNKGYDAFDMRGMPGSIMQADQEIRVFNGKMLEVVNPNLSQPTKGKLGGQEGFFSLGEIANTFKGKQETGKLKGSVLDEIKQGFKEGADKKPQTRTKGARTQLLDRLSPVFDLTKQAGDLPAEKNPYKRMRLLAGVSGKIEATINQNLAPVLRKESQRLDDLSALLVMQREAELIGRGKTRARNVDELRQGVQELVEKHGVEGFQSLNQSANQIRQFGNSLLEQVHQAGIIDDASFKEIKDANRFYVPFDIVDHIAENMESGKFNMGSFNVASQDVIKGIGSTKKAVGDPLEALLRKTSRVMALTEKNKAIQSLVDLRNESEALAEIIKPLKSGEAPKGFDTVNVFENGKNVRYAVPEEVAAAIKNLDAESAGIIVKVLSPQAKLLRAGATALNIGFIPANIARDFADALFSETTEGGIKQAGQFLLSYPAALFNAARQSGPLRKAFGEGDLYAEWLKAGGAQSTLTEQIFKKSPQTLKELSGQKSVLKTTLESPKSLIEFANQVGEQSTRLARFRAGIKRGESLPEAAFKSRDITLDFAKAGNTVKTFNQVIPFLNAGIQGTEKMMRLAKDNPKGFIMASTILYGTPTLLLYKHNQQFEDYKDIPEAEKQQYWIMMSRDRTPAERARGDKIVGVKIPKGFLGRPISTTMEGALNFIDERDPEALKELFVDVAGSLSPIGVRPGEVSSALLPPGAQAGIEGYVNRNLYFDTPIVPRSMENLPPELQVKDSTTPIARGVGKLTGVSPLKIDNAIGTMTGGVGRQIGQLTRGDIQGATTGQISRRLVGIREGKITDQQYEKRNSVDQAKEAIKAGRIDVIPQDIPENQQTYLIADYVFSKIDGVGAKNVEEKRRLYQQFQEQGLLTPDVEEVIVNIKSLEDEGLTKMDREMLLYDGEMRARQIISRFDSLKSKERKQELYKLYQQYGIINPEIEQMIVELKK